jgi:hypothetical protein
VGDGVSYVRLWATAFVVTWLSELAVATPFLPRSEPRLRRLGAVTAANVLSHPAVWFVFPEVLRPYWVMLVAAELWAFCSEALLYRLVFPSLSWRRAFGVSALANGVSLGLGLVLRLLGAPL